jgi:hypothetical protein
VIFVLARRSLLAHPVRSAVLAGGFGLGVAVMASLLGIGEVILAQARAPALRGGGDVVVVGATGPVGSARYVLSSVLGTPPLAARVAAASPIQRRALFLVRGGRVVPIRARGGVPSLDRTMGDRETAAIAAWADTPADAAWAAPEAGAVLRAMDRFHPIPDAPARAGSWAEWLYFNGQSGDTRFYLTFLVGPAREDGKRGAGVRLQLEQRGRMLSFSEGDEVDAARVLADAPDLVIGKSRVRLDGRHYRVSVDLPSDGRDSGRVTGELTIEAEPGRSMPPFTIRGAGGWVSGYVVPVMSGALAGRLTADGHAIMLDGGSGYHDHNWGFWEGVTWQWGQVQHDGLSFIYGRVHPPADAADPERMPGFLGVLGREGPIGYSTSVTIEETSDPGSARPRRIVVKGRGPSLAVTMEMDVEHAVSTRMPARAFGGGMDFYQLRARYRVSGRAAGRRLDFEAPGAAETFRGGAARPPG